MINNYFDKIICINLDKRTDRLKESWKQWSANNLIVERMSAVEGNPMGWRHVTERDAGINTIKKSSWNGAAGCMASHVNIWKRAKAEGWKNVLIIEDDCDFIQDLQNVFSKLIKEVPIDWDLLYLGGVHEEREGRFIPTEISENIVKCARMITTTCYAINESCYDLAINSVLAEEPWFYTAVDGYLAAVVQPKCNAYAFNAPLAWQRGSHSDIQNAHRDYSEDMKKKYIIK
jgi:GR25 family glycosyltransferase involved in LPS biosynthesis